MISIIIPIYNVEDYLGSCLDSCLAQTYKNFEIIAINDGSTDASRMILDSYKKLDSRIKVIHKENEGVAKARLIGIEHSNGNYLLFLDSDDTLPNNSLELLRNSIKKHDSDIAAGNYCECYKNGKTIIKQLPMYESISTKQYLELLLCDKIANTVCFKLYKSELAKELEYVNYKLGEDTILLVQLLLNSKKISFVEENVYNYLQRQSSVVHQKKPTFLSDMFYYKTWIIDYLKKKNVKGIDEKIFDLYIVQGYIKCLFEGGGDSLPYQKYFDLKFRYNNVYKQLPLWERIIYRTFPLKFIHKITIDVLRYIRNLKYF